jgi:hypothetical protein
MDNAPTVELWLCAVVSDAAMFVIPGTSGLPTMKLAIRVFG